MYNLKFGGRGLIMQIYVNELFWSRKVDFRLNNGGFYYVTITIFIILFYHDVEEVAMCLLSCSY